MKNFKGQVKKTIFDCGEKLNLTEMLHAKFLESNFLFTLTSPDLKSSETSLFSSYKAFMAVTWSISICKRSSAQTGAEGETTLGLDGEWI